MNAIGNDFVIVDVRKNDVKFSSIQIQKICDRKNIGCDQFILIKNCDDAHCFMEIFNQDGSKSGACGNATRCVASLIMAEKNLDKITIKTDVGILPCEKKENEIIVAMSSPKFGTDFYFDDLKFSCVDVGNPHAVSFANYIPADEEFFSIAPQIEKHQFFPNKTNVEFVKILPNSVAEVRVFERGVGETMGCGSGACAVAAIMIKNKRSEEHTSEL